MEDLLSPASLRMDLPASFSSLLSFSRCCRFPAVVFKSILTQFLQRTLYHSLLLKESKNQRIYQGNTLSQTVPIQPGLFNMLLTSLNLFPEIKSSTKTVPDIYSKEALDLYRQQAFRLSLTSFLRCILHIIIIYYIVYISLLLYFTTAFVERQVFLSVRTFA